jgi:acyl-CoA thioesterase II
MALLAEASVVRQSPNGLTALLDPEWNIWGPVSGFVAAIALRAVGVVAPAGHRPVSLSCLFVSRGENGPVDIVVEPIKSGSTAFWIVELSQAGKCVLRAQICTTAKTDGPTKVDCLAPDVSKPDALEPFVDQLRRFGHEPIPFWLNVEGRQVDFRSPGDPDPRGGFTERWMRFKDWDVTSDPFLDAARAIIGIDTHIWAAYNRGLTELPKHVAPSLDLTVWFHDAAPESAWQLIVARSDFAAHALLSGLVDIWSEDGKLVARGGSQCLFVPLRD